MVQKLNFANLEIEIHQNDHSITYYFRGDVDENFRQQDVPRIKKQNIILELKDINNFNSCGIREWIYLVKDLSEQGNLTFKRCSVTMIDQINMVPDSLGKGTIESFYAPYYCSTHGEINKLIVVKDNISFLQQKCAPEFRCKQTGELLEFDALEESYFLFTDNSLSEAS